VKDYWFWLAVRSLSGCSTAATVWGGFALCNRMHADEAAARKKAMSTATAGLYAGVILGPQAGGLFVDDSSSLFLLLSGAQLCTFLMLRFRLPDQSQQKQTQTDRAVDMMSLVMDPDVRNPIIALFLGLAFIAALDSTAFEYMVRLGYGQMKQNLTWLLCSVPAVLFACLVPTLRTLVEGRTLQVLAMLLGGVGALQRFDSDYILLALTLPAASVAAGIVDGNTPAMLADRSQEKYGGTGQVFVLSNMADQVAFIVGPAAGSIVCQQLSFPLMCKGFGCCMLLYAFLMAVSTLRPEDAKPAKGKRVSNRNLRNLGAATRCLQHRGDVDDGIGCVGIPIHLSQAFIYQSPGTPYPKGAIYGRFDHPTRLKLEQCHASLETALPHVLAFNTYEAAVASLLAQLRSGHRMLLLGTGREQDVLRFFRDMAAKRSFQLTQHECTAGLSSAARVDLLSGTKLCWLNGALERMELLAWAKACRQVGAILVTDAYPCPPTSPTSALLAEGVSVALYPCAFISGRDDVHACMLSTDDTVVFKSAQYFRQTMGSTPGNFECYLAFRGLLSLKARRDRQAASTSLLVQELQLSAWVRVERVADTSFQLGFNGFQAGSLGTALARLSLCSTAPRASKFETQLKFASASSAASTSSTSPWMALRTHARVQGALVHVEVGLENPEDLLKDLLAAFQGAERKPLEGFASRMLKSACDPSPSKTPSKAPSSPSDPSDPSDAASTSTTSTRYPQSELGTLERLVAEAHATKFAVAFASGSAAYHVLLDELSPGDHVIASKRLYVGAFEAFQDIAADAYGVKFTFVNLDDLDAVAAAMLPETRLLWVESASNPLGHPADVVGLARLCRRGSKGEEGINGEVRRPRLVVDNTWCGPLSLRPSELGADLVLESLTKAIGGHSDLLLGAICTDSAHLHAQLYKARARLGNGPAKLDCDLAISSLCTYEARMDVMSSNARSVASALQADHRISKVHFLGFERNAEMRACPGNMIAFYLDGQKEDAVRFLENLLLIKLVGSFGDCCTIIDLPYTMFAETGADLKCGIADNLLRLSVGLEDAQDIIWDLLSALSIAMPAPSP